MKCRRPGISAMALMLCAATARTPASAALAQPTSSPPVWLSGVTTVRAPAYSARMLVNLPQRVHYPGDGFLDLPYLSVSGTAAAAAFYLIPTGTRMRQAELPMFGRLPTSLSDHTVASFPDGEETIPAGDYWLVTVHTPGTATFTIRLPGLNGRVTVKPQSMSSASMALLRPPQLVAGHYPPTGTSGIVTKSLAGKGFVGITAGVELPVGGVSHTETCFYPGGGDLPSALNLLPGCSDGSAANSTTVQGALSYTGSAFLNWGAGKYGAAIDYQATNVPTAVAGWAAWVPYDG